MVEAHCHLAKRIVRLNSEPMTKDISAQSAIDLEIDELRAMSQKTARTTVHALEDRLYKIHPVLDHGFVRVVDYSLVVVRSSARSASFSNSRSRLLSIHFIASAPISAVKLSSPYSSCAA